LGNDYFLDRLCDVFPEVPGREGLKLKNPVIALFQGFPGEKSRDTIPIYFNYWILGYGRGNSSIVVWMESMEW
jgi:hypothetical protein